MVGIFNQSNITQEQITQLANFTQPHEFFIQVNHVVYAGWLYFILLLVTWVILLLVMQAVKDQLLNNAMYSGAIVSIISFILRAVWMTHNGIVQGLLTDEQMWLFPVATILLAAIVWAIKRR